MLGFGFFSGTPKFFGKVLQFHQLLKSLINGKAQVLADQRSIHIFLVGLDYGINVSVRFGVINVIVHHLHSTIIASNTANEIISQTRLKDSLN
jgi:hypothetical protein